MVWAVRIAGFLLFRVLRRGSDSRFDEIRSHFFKFLGFWIGKPIIICCCDVLILLFTLLGQIVWVPFINTFYRSSSNPNDIQVWTVSLPLTILNSPAVSDTNNGGSDPLFGTARDITGIVLWALGFTVEAIADYQKFSWKSSPTNDGGHPINSGLWAWSRHPPYFGEIMCWWGIWILCLSPTTNGSLPHSAKAAQYGAIMSPLFTVLILMFVSGIPSAEKPQAKRYYLKTHGPEPDTEHADAWPEYQAYLKRTSILIPIPQVIYNRVPTLIKKTLLLDFPMYQFDENGEGKCAREEARSHQEA
ncbi:hypothetical protein H2248_010524 [Termitomyces sp. 'cryptogamus']|nr:hypothetical protein H2248_010524 [Termitomyces sp. 'cryptogamus']